MCQGCFYKCIIAQVLFCKINTFSAYFSRRCLPSSTRWRCFPASVGPEGRPAESFPSSVQPKLRLSAQQELTSPLCNWTENAAAGKMAPNTAPLKGEKQTFKPCFYAQKSFSFELSGCSRGFPAVSESLPRQRGLRFSVAALRWQQPPEEIVVLPLLND